MLKNYLKIALRHLWRNRLYAFINIAGLTLGMACALLAILYVQDEMSYDRFHKNASELYRLTTTIIDQGSQKTAGTGQVQGPAFKAAIPEISDYVRILAIDGINISSNNKSLAVKDLYVDESFFNLFSFPLLYGNQKAILSDPFSIVLSETTALKFFGSTDVVGRILKIEEGRGVENLTITGVAKDAPANSSIQFDVLVPFKYLQLMWHDENWLNEYLTTFVLLHPGADPKIVQQKITEVFKTEAKEQLLETKSLADQYQFGLQPITNFHLHTFGLSYGDTGLSDRSTTTYSYILMGIVAFILLMACVNFINLSISDSLKRAKEIGVRKIAGSNRRQIVSQFLVEAAILCFISYVFAVLIGKLLLPVFNQLADKKISLSGSNSFNLYFYGAILMLICIVIAGIYPAVTLSLFNPAEVLYSKQKLSNKNLFGKGLIVLQFTLAVSLIISTIIYYKQMKFISNENLGYNAADIIKIPLPPQRIDSNVIATFRNSLLKDPSVKQVTTQEGPYPDNTVSVNSKNLIEREISVDEFYLSTLEIPLKTGRNFSNQYGTDAAKSVIVNETFVKSAGWENPIGQQITYLDDRSIKTVIGEVKDYHYGSLKEKIEPQILSMRDHRENVLIKIQKEKMVQALNILQTTYNNLFPQHYFNYQFLDDENAGTYQIDKRWKEIISYSALLAILICCIGLFGLSSFTAQRRYKEIGIRKVLGASVVSIAALLTRDFLKLVLIAIMVASPFAWYVMHFWLQNFAYKINIGLWVFVLAGFVALIIALLTVSFEAIKAAMANPVKSLRTE